MPAANPPLAQAAAAELRAIGGAVRARRKSLGVSATATAEAAGMSRVTLHRIEQGEPSVTMGAYMAAAAALGLSFALKHPGADASASAPARAESIPAQVPLAHYPKLRELAWHVHGTPVLTAREAMDIYERNWRHLDPATLSERERELIEALRHGVGEKDV